MVTLGLRNPVLPDFVEQRLVADLQHAACLRFQFVCSKARVMASASASSFALRASDFRPPGWSPFPEAGGLLIVVAAVSSSLIAKPSSPRIR